MKKYRTELKLIADCAPNTRKILFKHGDKQFIQAIVDAVWTTLAGKVPLSKKQLEKIRRVQPTLRRLAAKKRTVKQRRRLLCTQRGGNAFHDLINIVQQHF